MARPWFLPGICFLNQFVCFSKKGEKKWKKYTLIFDTDLLTVVTVTLPLPGK